MDIAAVAVAGQEPQVPAVVPVMDQVLTWIGFEAEGTRARLQEEGFESFADVMEMKAQDVRDLADSYVRRTVADGRAIFGLRRTRYMI